MSRYSVSCAKVRQSWRHKGLPILQIDFEGCSPADFLGRIKYARSVIGSQPLNSVRTLTLIKQARFNNIVSEAIKEYTNHNKPFVRNRSGRRLVGPPGRDRARGYTRMIGAPHETRRDGVARSAVRLEIVRPRIAHHHSAVPCPSVNIEPTV